MEITLRVSGMDCAACAPRLQRRLVAVAGVERVMVNYAASRCKIEYDGEHADYAALYAAVRRTGFDVPPETAEIECAAFDREAARAALEALDGVRRVEDTGDGKLRAVLWTGVESKTLLAALRARGIYAAVTGRTGGDEEIQLHSRMALLRALCVSVLFTMPLVWDLHPYVQLTLASVVQFGPGRCSFDSDAFKQLLAFADQFKSDAEMASYEYTDEDSAAYRISQGQQMLTEVSLFNFNESSGDNPFNTDVTYIGFPNVTGEPGNVLRGINELGITSACRDKAAAWEFVRTFLTEDYQTELSIFPTNVNAFNTLLDEAQVIEYERDANGNILLDENGEKKRLIIGVMYDGINYTNMYSGISPERAETIKTLAQSTSKLLNYDQSILDIVTSEAQAYFAGQKSADEVARLVQSKANIYVNEQR